MTLIVRDAAAVRWIYFNRPEHLNALTQEDMVEARQAVQEADGLARVMVFGGVGERAFSAGVHMDAFFGLDDEGARALIGELKSLLECVRLAPMPTICAVNGFCLGERWSWR